MPAQFAARPIVLHVLCAVATLIILTLLIFSAPYQIPTGDEPRYIILGANLFEHGVISSQPYNAAIPPAATLPVGGPLTAFELAAAMTIDPVTRDYFVCFLGQTDCAIAFPGLRAIHVLELALFLSALWWITARLTSRTSIAWLAVAVALLCQDLTFDSKRVLTEPLSLACIGALLCCWLAVWDQPTSRIRAALLGAALAATILVKPAFQAVIPLTLVLYAATLFAWNGRGKLGPVTISGGVFLLTCFAGLLPFFLYFQACCGIRSLSDPTLLEAALSHRVAYNAMGFEEWLAGWVYFLPDFGDNLAPALFPNLEQIRLGWDQNSYYVFGRDVLHADAKAITAPQPATGHLMETYISSDPVWHAATSALLLWRGIFVGKLWGLVALPFLLAYPFLSAAPNRLKFCLLLVPVIAIAGLQSGISVSIPRYNLALILPMSLAFAWSIYSAARWAFGKWAAKPKQGW